MIDRYQEVQVYWRVARELQSALVSNDNELVLHCLDELEAMAMHSPSTLMRRCCRSALARHDAVTRIAG